MASYTIRRGRRRWEQDKYAFFRTDSANPINDHTYGKRSFLNAAYGYSGTSLPWQDAMLQVKAMEAQVGMMSAGLLAAGLSGGFIGMMGAGIGTDEVMATFTTTLFSPHTTLDAIGVIDPTGIADLTNAGIYLLEGDHANASISLAGALLPYAGDVAKLNRVGRSVVKRASRVGDTISSVAGVERRLASRVLSAGVHGTSGAALGGAGGFAAGAVSGYLETGTIQGTLDAGLAGAKWGAIQGGVGGAARGFVNPYICFVAGTRVVVEVEDENGADVVASEGRHTATAQVDGHTTATATSTRRRYVTVPIEELVARGGGEMGDGGGQSVISRDQHDPDGPLVRRRISRTYQRTAYSLQVLTLRDEQGNEQTLRVTEEHPFHLAHAGWTAARLLHAGDVLFGADGTLTVVANEHEAHPQGVAVYNLEVERDHTYFVLAEHARKEAAPAWVHNAQYDIVRTDAALRENRNINGVLNEWAEHNIVGYKKADAPALTLTPRQHDATRSVFAYWRYERTGSVTGAIDWKNVSTREIQSLSDRMFNAAGVPAEVQSRYYRALNSYLYTGSF